MAGESKVHWVRPGLEYKRVAEDTKVWVCLPTLRREKNEGKGNGMQEKAVSLRRALGMEKEHSARSQSAQSAVHIVTCPASGSNTKLQYGGKFL